MENIRRNIKLFFVRHGSLIFTIIAFFLILITIVQFFERRAQNQTNITNKTVQKNENIINTSKLKNQKEQDYKKLEEERLLIEEFIDYCKNDEIDKAYDMLSLNCKDTNYPTILIFKQNYIDNIFKQAIDYEIEEYDENLYKIIFYTEDMLQSGKMENRKKIEMSYKLINNIEGIKKIEIN